MKIFTRRKTGDQNQLTREQALACIPVKNLAVTTQQRGDVLLLEYPLPLRPFFLQLAQRFLKQPNTVLTKKIELDQYGSKVWKLIDNRGDIATIITAFAAGSGLTLHDAEMSVTAFIRELGRRGLVSITENNNRDERTTGKAAD